VDSVVMKLIIREGRVSRRPSGRCIWLL